MATISLCMIVKNEEQYLKKCLESVKDAVDEIVIVDTGSTDKTKDIASSFTPHVVNYVWRDDFSAARNFAFAQATSSYILWLDADDILLDEDQKKLVKLKSELDETIDAITMVYHYAFDEFGNVTTSLRRNRLVKRSCRFQWIGPVHEYLDVKGNSMHSDIIVTHTRKHAHTGRNLAIFEKRFAGEERFSPRDLYYYGNELMDNQHYQKAADIYERFIANKDGWVEDIISACFRLSEAYMHLGENKKAFQAAIHSFNYAAPRAELCCRLGSLFLMKKNMKEATYWFSLATELEKPKQHIGFVQDACWTWFPHLQLCICYYYLGDYEKSHHHNEIARKYRPTDQHVLHNKKLLEAILKIPEVKI